MVLINVTSWNSHALDIRQRLIIAILPYATLFFAGCHAMTDYTTQNVDSAKTFQTFELRQHSDTVLIKQGQTLFKTNCNSCHEIFKTDIYWPDWFKELVRIT